MIIDIHSHLAYAPLYPACFLSNMFNGLEESKKSKLNKMLPFFLKDKEGSDYLKQMDTANIDKAVLLIIDAEIALGETRLNIEEIYKVHYNVLKNHSDRFLVFAGIDPRRGKKGFDLLRKGIEEYRFQGLKLYPPMGFSMDHERLLPIYEYCQQGRLPVLIHTGPSQGDLWNEYANPLFIKSIAEKYKGINFILAHAGFSLNNDLIKLIENTNNVFIDVAGFQSKYPKNGENMSNDLSILFCNESINAKVLFGTDWPLFNFMHPVSRQVGQIKELARTSKNNLERSLGNILCENAKRVLNI